MNETIKTIWRLGYIKLFDDDWRIMYDKYVSLDDGEWTRIVWRIYWKTSGANQ